MSVGGGGAAAEAEEAASKLDADAPPLPAATPAGGTPGADFVMTICGPEALGGIPALLGAEPAAAGGGPAIVGEAAAPDRLGQEPHSLLGGGPVIVDEAAAFGGAGGVGGLGVAAFPAAAFAEPVPPLAFADEGLGVGVLPPLPPRLPEPAIAEPAEETTSQTRQSCVLQAWATSRGSNDGS